ATAELGDLFEMAFNSCRFRPLNQMCQASRIKAGGAPVLRLVPISTLSESRSVFLQDFVVELLGLRQLVLPEDFLILNALDPELVGQVGCGFPRSYQAVE